MNNTQLIKDATTHRMRVRLSYQTALNRYRQRGITHIPWAVWLITIVTVAVWCFTAYQTAVAVGTHTLHDIISNIVSNAINIQDQEGDALTRVLITYGAKENKLILQGQHWRFITPMFLHANVLHVGLNMLNFFVLGIFLERLLGHLRFLLIYLVTGVISIIASFYFAPQEVSVGASGAIFGLVGAYSIFILMHRQAFRHGGIPAILWLVVVVGINLSIGFFVQNVDNYAHIGGLLSGCLLGWWFTPIYQMSPQHDLIDAHSLARRWPLALLTILGTLLLAVIARYLIGG